MRALILVDIQNDFLPGGALAVPDGDKVVPVANSLMDQYDLVVATQDWHPADHGSFAAEGRGEVGQVIQLDDLPQVLWPEHCVQNSAGAELSEDLRRDRIDAVFTKGENPRIDSYSGFFDNGHRQATGLAEYLRQRGVDEVHLAGLATDYCVKYTALDAVQLGFRTVLIEDATRGVNLQDGDVDRAIQELRSAGVEVTRSDQILQAAAPQVLHEGRFLDLVSQNGWEYARRSNAHGVVVVVAVDAGQVLLIEQHRPPAGGATIELPAGLAGDDEDRDEPLLAAAQRELLEETGMEADRWTELMGAYASPGLTDEKLTYFWARQLHKTGPGGGVGGERIQLHWVPLAEVSTWLGEQLREGRRVSNQVLAGLYLLDQHVLAAGTDDA